MYFQKWEFDKNNWAATIKQVQVQQISFSISLLWLQTHTDKYEPPTFQLSRRLTKMLYVIGRRQFIFTSLHSTQSSL